MKYSIIAATVAALAFTAAANAAGPSDCAALQKKTAEAIAAASSSQAVAEARNLAQTASTYCATSMYAQGVARYNQALKILSQG